MGNIADIYGGGFDTDRDDAATGYEPIPAGWYHVQIDDAEIKDTKAGTGKYLMLELTVIEENFGGRKLFSNITLFNPNEKAMEIGQRELSAVGQACGLAILSDTDELLGKQIQVRVKIGKERDGYEAGNDVTAFRSLNATSVASLKTAPTPAAARPVTPPPPPPPAAAKRPWEK